MSIATRTCQRCVRRIVVDVWASPAAVLCMCVPCALNNLHALPVTGLTMCGVTPA